MKNMFLIVITAAIVVLLFYYSKIFMKRTKELGNKIPGPATWPIIGNANIFLKSNIDSAIMFMDYWKKYGDRCRFFLGHKILVLISDPDDVEDCLNKISDKADDYQLIKRFLGNGIFLNDGKTAAWKRKIILPTFHVDILKGYLPIMNRVADKIVEKLETLAGGPQFDISQYSGYYAGSVITETVMGIQNTDIDENTEYTKALLTLVKCTDARFTNILFRSQFIFDMTNYRKLEIEALKTVQTECHRIIVERKTYIENIQNAKENSTLNSINNKLCYLDMLLLSKYEDGTNLDYDLLFYDTQNILFAGQDTTNGSIAFTLYELSRNLSIQTKIYDEQVRIFGEDRVKAPSAENLHEMTYLDMVIRESLRKYPVATTFGKRTKEETNINGMILPEGCNIFISVLNMHHNPKYYPDPLKFDPDRFLPENVAKRPAKSYIPFSASYRSCIGKKFAMWEMKNFFSKIIRNFVILPGNQEMEIRYTLLMKPKNGVYVKVVKRK